MEIKQVKLGIYKHSKSGKLYKLIGIARNSENPDEELVVYQALYETEKFPLNQLWIRPKKMFFENVIIDGKAVPRFEFLKEKED